MKKLLLTAIAILGASAAYSQVGIGTRTPNNSSQLEVTVDGQPEKRGILIPRVALQSTSSMNPIVNTGTLPNSLLVFNTAETGTAPLGVTPGFYYWYENKWIKMISNGDDTNTTNVSLTQNGQDLILTDSDGNNVRIALSDLQKITTLVNNNDGTYTYTNEAGTQVTINVPADVISNFQNIISNSSVLNQLITNLTNTSVGGNVYYDGNSFTYVDNTGTSHTINIQDIVRGNETVTTLVNNNDGTYTYTNEAGTQVTIDVPADVVSNFNDIITNTSVLNQLITNLTNTSVGGNVYYDGASFTYVDNTGTSHTINIQDIVRGNETVTTLVDNNNGTYTYTSENGTVTTIDVPADVIQNFQDIMNDNSVSTIVKNIIDANETLTVLGYDPATKKLTYKDEDGRTTILDMSQLVTGNETVTTLVNNNDGTYTYTNEAGAQVTINVPTDVISNFQNIISNSSVLNQLITNLTNTSVGGNVYYDGASFTYVDNTGTSHTINIQDIVRGNETVTTLVDNNNGTYTYTSEDGTVTTIDVPADVIQNFQDIMNDNSVSTIVKNIIDANETLTVLGYDPATKKLTYKDENGNTTTLDMAQLVTGNETVTTLVDNNNGTYTYTSENGTVTTIDVPADVIQNFQDIMNDNSVSTIIKNIIDANETLTILGYDSATKKLTYKDENGNTTTLDMAQLVTGNETVTTLVDNNNGTYTYTSEDGTVTTIDVPADVIQNFQDIMNDNSVSTIIKNIIDANETLTILGYDSATKKLTYKDENGNTTTLDMAQLVTGNQTITTLVDNNNGTYTYTSENGTVTTIDVPADVIQNFQDIMNDNSVSTIVKNIIDANETLTVLGYDSATKKLTYKDENGNTTTLDMAQLVTGNETVTTLVNNNDGTYTYTNEAGTQVTIDVPADVVSNFNDIITNTSVLNQLITNLTNTSVGGNVYYDGASFTYVDNTGTSHTISIQDIVQANQKIVTLSNGTNTTVASTSAGNTTDYKVNVNPATTTTTGAVKAGAGLDVAADGTLTVNVNTIPNATDKTATVAAGTNTTVAVNNANPNNPVYTVNVPTANGTALGVVKEANTAPTINIAADGTLSVNTTALQNNQKTSSVVAGTATTVTSATSGNNTAYTVNVNPATASATGAVKPGTGLSVAADGTLSVNTTATGLGKTLSTDGIIQVNSANTLANSVLADAALSIANNSITTAKIANAGNNQVLTTDGTGAPTWVNQSALVPATTNTLVNNGTNTLTSTVNGAVATAAAVNSVTTTLSGSNLTTTVNGVGSTALDLAPVVAANDKTSSVVSGTTTTVTSATSGNNTAYTVEINPSAVQSNQKTASVTGSGLATVTSSVSGNNTAYNVDVSAANVQSNQKTSSVVAGTATTVTSATSGNNTAYTVNVSPATASATGAVKPGTGLSVAADGTLSVNTSASGIGNTFSSTDLDITNGSGATLTAVTANIKDGAVTSAKILDGTIVNADIAGSTITAGKLANAGNNQVLTTNATGVPTWADQSTLITANQKNTTVSSGTYTTLAITTPNTNTTNYQVDVSPTALAGAGLKLNTVTGKIDVDINTIPNASDKTATVAAGTNTSITTNNANPNNPIYTVNVPTANGTALGVVKEAAVTNPTIKINSNGELSVNLSGTGTPTDPGAGKNFTSSDLDITNGSGATLTTVTANIKDGAVTSAKILDGTIVNADIAAAANVAVTKLASGGNNKVLVTNSSGTPSWIDQSTLVTATTNTLVNNGTNTLTSTVNGVVATAPAVNTVATTLSGSNLTTTVNGVSGSALNLTPVIAANDKTATVAAGTNTTVTNSVSGNTTNYIVNVPTANGTSLGVVKEANTAPTINIAADGTLSVNTTALQNNQKTSSVVSGTTTTVTSATSGNNTAYTVEITPSSVQSSQKTTSVTGSGLATVTSSVTGNNTAYNVDVTAGNIQSNQKLTTLSNGTNTTVASTVSGNTTDYKVNVPTAGTTLGVVKQAASNPTVTIAPDGTLSVNTTATGLGKTLTTDGIIQVNSANTLANSVLADAALSIANNSITTAKIADDAVTVAKIANAGNNQVLTTDGTGAPTWVNQSALVPATTNTLVNNGTNTLTSTVNGVVASAAAVNAVTTTLSGSNLTTTVNGVSSVALNLAPVVAANDKTSTVAAGTNVTVATNTTNPNNPVYTVNVPTANGTNLGVVKEANTAPTINIAADGTLSVNTTALQNNQKTSSVVAGTATTVTSATSGNNTAYTVNVSPATASTTGAVKPGTGLLVAADGTLSVNTTATGLGKTLTTDGIIQVNSSSSLANSVLADAALSIANNSITTAKIADDAVTVAKIANAGNNQVLTTDATGVPTWVNKNTLDNIYTADGSLAGDRTVNMNGKFLRFRSTSLPVASPETRETIFNYSNGAYITNATTTGRSNFRVSSGSSMVDLYQDLNSRAQLTSSGTSTGLLVGTANGSATPVELITNGTSRVHVSSTGKVGIGTQNMLGTTNANVLLAVNGSIETANSTYADYVFEDYFNGASELKKDYTFKSIKEVEAFINENKHLPGITSIKDLRQNDKGEYIFNMSELSIQILEKVEELYLHTIEQQKQLEAKDKEINQLKEATKSMDERLKQLEKIVLSQNK